MSVGGAVGCDRDHGGVVGTGDDDDDEEERRDTTPTLLPSSMGKHKDKRLVEILNGINIVGALASPVEFPGAAAHRDRLTRALSQVSRANSLLHTVLLIWLVMPPC